MYPALILALYVLAVGAQQIFELDCTNSPQSCDNDCYAVFLAGLPSLLNYDPNISQSAARRASGCTQSNGLSACGANGITKYISTGLINAQCDEYPYASTSEGGAGSVMRCVNGADNGSEGGQLGAFYTKSVANGGCGGVACAFQIFFTNYDLVAYCYYAAGPNDGYEFKLVNGQYVNAKRDVSYRRGLSSGGYEPVQPRADAFIPFSKRREFMTSDGVKLLSVSGDMKTDFVGRTIATSKGNATIVKELLGTEKSKGLQ